LDQLPRFLVGNISMPTTIINAESMFKDLDPSVATYALFQLGRVGFTAIEIPALSVDSESDMEKLRALRFLLEKWKEKKYHFLRELMIIPIVDPRVFEEDDVDVEEVYFKKPLEILGMESFPLVQVGTRDWSPYNELDALDKLNTFSKKGLIGNIGVLRMDAKTLKSVLDEGIPIATNRVPYSMIDRRPQNTLFPLAREKHVSILLESPLADGWLEDQWIGKRRIDWIHMKKLPKQKIWTYELVKKAGGWVYIQVSLVLDMKRFSI